MEEPTHVRLLRVLAGKSPQTSKQIAVAAGLADIRTPHRASVYANTVLNIELERGHTRKAGIVRSEYHNVPTILWEITPAGHEYLGGASWTWASTAKEERAGRWSLAIAQRRALVEHLDRESCLHGWGPGTPAPERRDAIVAMRGSGCTLQSLADTFGITREYVRLIAAGRYRRGDQWVSVGGGRHTRKTGPWIRLEKVERNAS